ncbi:MBL fold metallo-hydrolase [Eubacterium sp. am_0171]|uniref:MBL fold metallo-hydrolase n=1 Tax=unclassified Eubacterium (in: firmicutes) TaxID=2624479 RepID=UPI00101F77B3|nr:MULTISPECIES: MBL fold metallo-hydrolase [unclassified Eubacterium (in: firmicutes)]MSC84334.1 MBL fold metallo-hydrolase [Eubacterium sp. BIOML-A1]MSD05880.1 MBL fold metallo-hydrolase [Eubacterium sp. BIOML-A2]RYT23254.1 MBL fold metallo-hydrolase [Eubacterium sp. am_0171]
MKLTILGTGNATVTDCYNTCFALSEEHRHFLVDAGGGNQILRILKKTNIPLEEIHDIFITHEHIDHLLGLFWLIRMIGQNMNQGKYEGKVRIYCHSGLIPTITTIAELTIMKKVTKHLGERIQLIPLESGDTKQILGCEVTFFDIGSTKARQFGFTLKTADGKKLSCCGDEPYNPCEEEYVRDSDWLMHEAFCLYREADKFKPYEKHHSTVKEACQLAEQLRVPNLILYHTEETHLEERKELYTEEGRKYYSGNLYVPDDQEVFRI